MRRLISRRCRVGTAAAERDANVMSGVGAGAALHGPRPRPLVGQ